MADLTCGTYSSYVNAKCRCADCCEANRAYKREYMRRRRQDPDFKTREKSNRNPETSRRATRNYLAKNPDHIKKWRQANPERARGQVQKRRARLAGADHGCVDAEFLTLIYSMPCAYCGSRCKHADHVYPLDKGGLHCVENIQPSCAHCNTSKGVSILANPPAPIRECEVVS